MNFKVTQRKITAGNRKGQTAYIAVPKDTHRIDYKAVVESIEHATSLTKGDVNSVIENLASEIKRALSLGLAVDMGNLGSITPIVPSKMLDKEEDVTAASALKAPRIVYRPKDDIKAALKSITLSVDNPVRQAMIAASKGTGSTGNDSTGTGGSSGTGGGNSGSGSGSGGGGSDDDDMS